MGFYSGNGPASVTLNGEALTQHINAVDLSLPFGDAPATTIDCSASGSWLATFTEPEPMRIVLDIGMVGDERLVYEMDAYLPNNTPLLGPPLLSYQRLECAFEVDGVSTSVAYLVTNIRRVKNEQ